MELKILRQLKAPSATLGELDVNGVPYCWTLEDTVRAPGVKVDKQTAIPPGRYLVKLTFSNRFQRILPELFDVPMFSSIRMHGGNTAANTEGCPLLGTKKDEANLRISNCAPAVDGIVAKIDAALKREEEVWCEIV